MTAGLQYPAGRPLVMAAAVLLLLTAGRQAAADQEKGQTLTGTIQKVGEGTLTVRMKGPEEKTEEIRVEQNAKVTLNGEEVELGDLTRGDQVKIKTSEGDRSLAADVHASRRERKAREETGEEEHKKPRQGGAVEEHAAEDRGAEEREEPSAVLGLIIAKPRGEERVVVVRVAPQSPAAQAGIQDGDEIVSVDGKEIASPDQLGEFIREKKPGAEVKIVYQREGEEKTATARLISREEMEKQMARGRESRKAGEGEEAGRRDQRRRGESEERAWLGVLLDEADEEGARVVHVVPGGPAEKAGIQPGDVIQRIDGREIDSPQLAGEMMQDKKPGDEVEIVVSREDEVKTLKARLAVREQRGERFRMGRPPFFDEEEMEDFPPRLDPRRSMEQQRRIEQTLRELREDLRRLQEEVAELKKDRSAKP